MKVTKYIYDHLFLENVFYTTKQECFVKVRIYLAFVTFPCACRRKGQTVKKHEGNSTCAVFPPACRPKSDSDVFPQCHFWTFFYKKKCAFSFCIGDTGGKRCLYIFSLRPASYIFSVRLRFTPVAAVKSDDAKYIRADVVWCFFVFHRWQRWKVTSIDLRWRNNNEQKIIYYN